MRRIQRFCTKIFSCCRLTSFNEPVFAFYEPSSLSPRYFPLKEGHKILGEPDFVSSKPTIIYIHGFLDSTKSKHNKLVVRAYQSREDHNLLAIDWSTGAKPDYFDNAITNMKKTGASVVEALLQMHDAGLDFTKLHLVGHSLGAQMAGLIGRTIKEKTGQVLSIKRITALDPAFPGFHRKDIKSLNRDDADFVDVIHTDGGYFGEPGPTGTVDFFPNSGHAPQPGCLNTPVLIHACGHSRAWWYWAESVADKNINKFVAVKAGSWENFKSNQVEGSNPFSFMGLNCQTESSGTYYLQTNGSTPFARGDQGTSYQQVREEGAPIPWPSSG
ncbi:phospholipase A1 member A-like isoform X2 [Hermetia illucens]|uniref:phospholipase A1 member A-like isoform X2 n=1 Tax=Hermetia illucens TaxID=343691 RepID=UPI0018CC57AB|nr:phospholipase A1 member A-like isoform X2 [Hermetia illucens]